MAKVYTSGQPAQSKIKKQGFQTFLSTLFGWRKNSQSSSHKPVDFVSVDVDSREKLIQAIIASALPSGKLSNKLEELFDSWLQDTSDSLLEISDRARRVDQLTYAVLNDPFIGRVVRLYADEATQLDLQDRIISIETPDPRMTKEMYDLLNQWGITQQRIRSTIEQLATYGDAFWANKISERGVERIIPLKQLQVSDRLEFNPVDALEKLKRQSGFMALANRQTLIQQMLDDLEEANDFADLFDTKLFGFVIQDDLVVPPWSITHFRANAWGGEFYPFGTSPILGTLAPFKLTASTITLQSIARVLSFPVTLYKVKTSEGMDEARQFAVVNRVREEYDNIGVSPSGGNSEVYTVNTKIWMPDGLMDVDVKASQIDFGFIQDIEMYQDRVAIATGVPKGYLLQDGFGAWNVSAVSLIEQFRPFARAVYSLQTAFLEGLADLFRLHFAINGKFDFRIPFTLGLRYPAEEISDDRLNRQKSSLDLASEVLNLIRTAIGAESDEALPLDITRDIISKYTFLDPTDVVKWVRNFPQLPSRNAEQEQDENELESNTEESEEEEEGSNPSLEDLGLGERRGISQNRLREVKKARLQELSSRYAKIKDSIYFTVLKEQAIGDFVRRKKHIYVSRYVQSPSSAMFEALAGNIKNNKKLTEEISVKDILKQIREDNTTN